jgi:hypothetical protein
MAYRVDFTIRIAGLEHETCHYCADLTAVNVLLAQVEEWQGWGISIHQIEEEERC